jgi:hypothetical protein
MEIDQEQVGRIISIRYKGSSYDHYGILDGKNGVIHVNKKIGKITCDPLDRVLRKAKKVKYLEDDFDTRWNQYEHAKSLIGSEHNYRFFTDNCESFVQKIRTGKAFSKQVDNMTNSISLAILVMSGIIGVSKIF